MLDPQTQKKIALLEAHYKSMGKILEELKGEQGKTNSRVKKYDIAAIHAKIESGIRSKINS